MSPRLKVLSGSAVVGALRHFGFEVVATRGSHAKLRRELRRSNRQTLTIPLNKELARGTRLAVCRQALRYIPESELRGWFFDEDG